MAHSVRSHGPRYPPMRSETTGAGCAAAIRAVLPKQRAEYLRHSHGCWAHAAAPACTDPLTSRASIAALSTVLPQTPRASLRHHRPTGQSRDGAEAACRRDMSASCWLAQDWSASRRECLQAWLTINRLASCASARATACSSHAANSARYSQKILFLSLYTRFGRSDPPTPCTGTHIESVAIVQYTP